MGRISQNITLYPGETLHLPVPKQFYSSDHVAVNPRISDSRWYTPGVYHVSEGHVNLRNTSPFPVTQRKYRRGNNDPS